MAKRPRSLSVSERKLYATVLGKRKKLEAKIAALEEQIARRKHKQPNVTRP